MRTVQEIDKEISELRDKLDSLYKERNQTNDLIGKKEFINKFIFVPNNGYIKVNEIESIYGDRLIFKGLTFQAHVGKDEYHIEVNKQGEFFLLIRDLDKIKKLTLEEFHEAYDRCLKKINRVDLTDFMCGL